MSARAQIATFVALLSLALAASVLFRREAERLHRTFAGFALSVGLLEAAIAFGELTHHPQTQRAVSLATVAVALTAMWFFRAFVREADEPRESPARAAPWLALPVVALVLSPVGAHGSVRYAVASFLGVSFTTTLFLLDRVRRRTRSRRDAERIRFLTIIGAVAGVLTLLDFVPVSRSLEVGSVAPIFLVGFLYMLSQAIVRERVLDLYDLAGRAGVLSTTALVLAGVITGLLRLTGMASFTPAFVASLAVMIVLDPLRSLTERWIARLFFGDRRELARRLGEARMRIAASIDPASAARIAVSALEATERVTHAAVYFVESDSRSFGLAHALRGTPPTRLDALALRPVLDRLGNTDALVLETIDRELERLRRRGADRDAETAFETRSRLDALEASVAVAIRTSTGELVGLLTARDERLRDAFAHDEISTLVGMGASLGAAFARSVEHRTAKDRERLVSLGEMAAGLAHEIRNPLGAIRATAQLLSDPAEPRVSQEMLGILVEEVDRLNGVVGEFLDYARPSTAAEATCDPVATVQRTVQLIAAEPLARGPKLELDVERNVPATRIDAEKLRQVVWNLVRNSLEALDGRGELRISVRTAEAAVTDGTGRTWVEVIVADDGPGIDESVLPHLFVPFVTTKARGTGLGLATTQRIVTEVGGRIEVRSVPGRGTTFTVRLLTA